MQKLKFSNNSKQAKLKNIPIELAPNRSIWSFNLPSGYSCPGALDCLSKADKITGKITDGKDTKYRCFAASDEARSTQARAQRWHNFDLLRKLKNVNDMAMLINQSLPSADVIRIHVSGDFYSLSYFIAWIQVAKNNRHIRFYAYTKSINFWVDCIDQGISIPSNLILNASRGGRYDKLIDNPKYLLKSAEVVFTPEEAEQRGLQIDHNDSLAMTPGPSFALLLHGTQPMGSVASKALKTLREKNIKYSYSGV